MARWLWIFLVACSGPAENQPSESAIETETESPTATPTATPTPAEAAPETTTPMNPAANEAGGFVDDRGIRWRLTAEPAAFTMAERGTMRLTIEATNEGDAEVDPLRHQGQWLFQGAQHQGLSLWFGNGLRVQEWNALPPGRTVTDARGGGEQLFDAPGTYEISYARGSSRTTARVVVSP